MGLGRSVYAAFSSLIEKNPSSARMAEVVYLSRRWPTWSLYSERRGKMQLFFLSFSSKREPGVLIEAVKEEERKRREGRAGTAHGSFDIDR